jgi:hypothetical protein
MRKWMTLLFGFFLAAALAVPVTARSAAALPSPPAAQKKTTHTAKKAKSAEHTYFGEISGSKCGMHHPKGADPHACTLKCVKAGAKYVFVNRGKIYTVENQDAPGLEHFAGERVRLIGNKSADGKSIKVARIVALKSRKKHKG